jgi:preprotein translocase SecE subunit
MQDENKNQKSFRQGMKAELKKVIWPTGKQVVKSTVATISFVLLISVILIVLNSMFSFITGKWYDFIDGSNNSSDNAASGDVSGDTSGDVISGDYVISGDEAKVEEASGESNVADTNVDSGDENSVTE